MANEMRVASFNKKSPQIVGLRSPVCWQFFYWANFNANPLNILVQLQLLWFHNTYQFKVLLHLRPFGRNLKGKLWDPQCLRVTGVLAGLDLQQSKAHPRLHNTGQYKVSLYLSPFGRNSNAKLWPPPQFDPHLRLRVDLGVENGTSQNLVPTFLFDCYAHCRPILHCLATIHNAADRQTERWQ